jgi:hypothetical protein
MRTEQKLPAFGQQIRRSEQILMIRIGRNNLRICKLWLVIDMYLWTIVIVLIEKGFTVLEHLVDFVGRGLVS